MQRAAPSWQRKDTRAQGGGAAPAGRSSRLWTGVLRYAPAALWVALYYSGLLPWQRWARPVSFFVPREEFWRRQGSFFLSMLLHFDEAHLWRNVAGYCVSLAGLFSDSDVRRGVHCVVFLSGDLLASGAQFAVLWARSTRVQPPDDHQTVSWIAQKFSPNVLSDMYRESLADAASGGASTGVYALLGWACARALRPSNGGSKVSGIGAVSTALQVLLEILPWMAHGTPWVRPAPGRRAVVRSVNTIAHASGFVAGAALQLLSSVASPSWWWPVAAWGLGVVAPFEIGCWFRRPRAALHWVSTALLTVFAGRPVPFGEAATV